MIKLLHTADIHLDSPLKTLALRDEDLRQKVQTATRGSFKKIIDLALEEEVAALLISGDLYDGAQRSAKTAAFVVEQLNRLRQKDIAVFYIKGNHDADNPITGSVALPDNVKTFTARGDKFQVGESDIFIHGVSFSGKQATNSLLDKFQSPVLGAVNIAMLHTSLAGSSGHDNYAPCTVGELTRMGFDYWALGHIHKRKIHSEAPYIIMPGIPQGRDIGEAGTKSATLLTVDSGKISLKECPTSQVEFHRLEINLADADDEDSIRQIIRKKLQDFCNMLHSEYAILRIALTGETTLYWPLIRDHDTWEESIRIMATDTGLLWIEKLEFDLKEPSVLNIDVGAVDELAALMREIVEEAGFLSDAITRLDEVVRLLAPDERASLLPDEKAKIHLLKELVPKSIRTVVALMKGDS